MWIDFARVQLRHFLQMQLISALEESYSVQLTMEDILFMSTIESVKSIVVKLTGNSEIC